MSTQTLKAKQRIEQKKIKLKRVQLDCCMPHLPMQMCNKLTHTDVYSHTIFNLINK